MTHFSMTVTHCCSDKGLKCPWEKTPLISKLLELTRTHKKSRPNFAIFANFANFASFVWPRSSVSNVQTAVKCELYTVNLKLGKNTHDCGEALSKMCDHVKIAKTRILHTHTHCGALLDHVNIMKSEEFCTSHTQTWALSECGAITRESSLLNHIFSFHHSFHFMSKQAMMMLLRWFFPNSLKSAKSPFQTSFSDPALGQRTISILETVTPISI